MTYSQNTGIAQNTNQVKILDEILNKIEHINFENIIHEENVKERLKQKHIIVIVVEKTIAASQSDELNITYKDGNTYIYNGTFWETIDQNKIQIFLGQAAQKMGVDKINSSHFDFKEKLFKQFCSVGGFQNSHSENDDEILINFENGTLVFKNGAFHFRKHDAKDFLRYKLPFHYNPNSQSSLFQNYLDQVLPEKALQNIISEFIGSIFVSQKQLKLEKALFLYGVGANGKSVLADIIYSLLGQEINVSSYSMHSLTDEKGYTRAMIQNRLLNIASELTGIGNKGIFKQLISREPIEARLPYGKPIIISNYTRLVFNCNELPKSAEQTDAFFRRFLIIPFNKKIEEKDQDKHLAQKIIENELEGVFNWVLNGLTRLLVNKDFSQSETVQQMVSEYRLNSDTVAMFLEEENWITNSTEFISLKEFYIKYQTYALECGHVKCSRKTFSERLRKIDFVLERKAYGFIVYAKIINV